MHSNRNILITGAAGFIGSHVLRLMVLKYPNCHFFNLDLLTYAGNLENIKDIESSVNYTFIKGDICDAVLVKSIFIDYKIDGVIHLAAESHVDRSIKDPLAFIQTNVLGTVNLLNAAIEVWQKNMRENCFIMFQQMRYMDLLEKPVCLRKPHLMILDLPIPLQKRVPIIL